MSEGVQTREVHRDEIGAAGAGLAADGGPPAVPLLEDLPALLGLVPTIASPRPDRRAGPAGAAPACGDADPDHPRGRPPRSAECRTTPFSVRLTRDERALLYRAALRKSPEGPVSCWAHDVLVAVARAIAEGDGD